MNSILSLYCLILGSQALLVPGSSKINFVQQASAYGYTAEQHTVTTEDGYILTLFRIPRGVKCQGKVRTTPVLLMHGLLQSSDAFLDASPTDGLAYLIPDECYDLWIGNIRGNSYSRRHVTYNADTDKEFWQFSVDEMGKYDIPATIKYVLNATGAEQLNYIGYSQGGGSFFIMCSEKPELIKRVRLFIGLAPASRQLNTKSFAYRNFSVAVNLFREPLEDLGVWEVLSEGYPIQGALSFLCQTKASAFLICGSILAIGDSPHPGSITAETYKQTFKHTPAGTSLKNFARYGQSMNSKKFLKFDYGPIKNLVVYGTTEPPEYDLSKVTVPVVAFQGYSDHIIDMADTEWAMAQMPNVVEFIKVADPLWDHLDMAYSQYVNETIFPKMKEYLLKYSDA